VTGGNVQNLLWGLAIVSGWLAILPLAGGGDAPRRVFVLLEAPLTGGGGTQAPVWERRSTGWTAVGLALAGLSILCFIGWLVLQVQGRS